MARSCKHKCKRKKLMLMFYIHQCDSTVEQQKEHNEIRMTKTGKKKQSFSSCYYNYCAVMLRYVMLWWYSLRFVIFSSTLYVEF